MINLQAPEREFFCEQRISRSIDEVFAFFASEENLEKITPPWLNFRLRGKSTAEMQTGTLIDYQLRLYGLPIKWTTLIESWQPNRQFVDIQLRGPYKRWHHIHTFASDGDGVLMSDKVLYQLPFGRAGDLLAAGKVRRQVEDIFSYRRKKIEEFFPN